VILVVSVVFDFAGFKAGLFRILVEVAGLEGPGEVKDEIQLKTEWYLRLH
jgi:hypothetical protein